MYIKIILLLLFVFTIFFSCKSDDQIVYSIDKSAFTADLSIKKSKTFRIDSVTDWRLISVQSFYINDTLKIASLDLVNNDILIFNYSTGILSDRISFSSDGEDALKSNLTGYHVFNKDSLVVIDANGFAYLTDFEGVINYKVNLDPDGIPGAPLNKPNFNQIVKIDESLYYDNYYIMNQGRYMKIRNSGTELSYFLEVPDEYMKGFWGIGDFMYFNFVYNEEKEEFIYNFPNLDSLYIWDKQFSNVTKVDASSKFINEPIKPILTFGTIPSEKTIKQEPLKRHVFSRLFYYDKKYFRLLGLPISQFDLDLNDPVKSEIRKYALIVFDNDFNWIGEYEIPFNKYLISPDDLFVNEHGIHFQLESKTEDEAVFEIWNF